MFFISTIIIAAIVAGLIGVLMIGLKPSRSTLSSEQGSTQKLSILIILAACFILLVTLMAWFALDQVEKKIQSDVGDALQIVLQTTQESLNLWVDSNKFQLTQIAEDPRLVALIERQLNVPRNKNALLTSKALSELRAFFWYRKNSFGQAGLTQAVEIRLKSTRLLSRQCLL